MDILIRDYTEADYDTACEWFAGWSWPILPPSLFPKSGFVAEKDGVPLAMVWLYLTNSAWGVMEWLVRDPKADKELCRAAMPLLVEKVKETAWGVGIEVIFTSVQHPNLIKLYKEHGFNLGDPNMTNMVARRP